MLKPFGDTEVGPLTEADVSPFASFKVRFQINQAKVGRVDGEVPQNLKMTGTYDQQHPVLAELGDARHVRKYAEVTLVPIRNQISAGIYRGVIIRQKHFHILGMVFENTLLAVQIAQVFCYR